MRFLPFSKGKKGFQFAGGGVTGEGGGLQPATSNTLGGVKIGSGVNVTSDGTISVSGGGGGLNISTTEAKVGTYNGSDMYARLFTGSCESGNNYVTLSGVGSIVMMLSAQIVTNTGTMYNFGDTTFNYMYVERTGYVQFNQTVATQGTYRFVALYTK